MRGSLVPASSLSPAAKDTLVTLPIPSKNNNNNCSHNNRSPKARDFFVDCLHENQGSLDPSHLARLKGNHDDKGSNDCGCFGRRDPSTDPPPPNPSSGVGNFLKSSPHSLVGLWNALKLKRAQTRHENEHKSDCFCLTPEQKSPSSKKSLSTRRLKQTNSFEASFSICKALRKSVDKSKKLKHKSKSDNCLNKIDRKDVHKIRQGSQHDISIHCCILNSPSSSTESTNRFTRKVFDQLSNAIRIHPVHSTVDLPVSPLEKPKLAKARSLEKEFELRIDTSTKSSTNKLSSGWKKYSRSSGRGGWCSREESQRRSRSLERNHRYLVTIDSTCRYSREVGSQQINLDFVPQNNNKSKREQDPFARYQPDPTSRLKSWNSLSSASTTSASSSSSTSSTHSIPSRNLKEQSHDFVRDTHIQISEGLIARALNKMPQVSMRPGSAMSSNNFSGPSQGGSGIVNKPVRGWLHPDHLFATEGVNYAVRYIGCLEVNTSMKVLDFDTRSSIAKECINRVCEEAGLKSSDKKRRSDRKIVSMLGEKPKMEHAGTNVQLTITSQWLRLSDLEGGQALFQHDMPNISFASGGDTDTLDFVAYVAKDRNNCRCCFVLECGGGLAQDVITTIGQAFELRFKEFLKRAPSNVASKTSSRPPPLSPLASSTTSSNRAFPNHHQDSVGPKNDEVEYYNDLPGKRPPPIPLDAVFRTAGKESVSSNLIDFNTEIPSHQKMLQQRSEPEYVNGNVQQQLQNRSASGARDPFDMSPFATTAPPIPSPVSSFPPTSFGSSQDSQQQNQLQLVHETWFHGPISRQQAEELVVNDGDFLVRESQGSKGQYVLTGIQNNSKKHLLLVDAEGVVRTKDRTFDSVSHLIHYHLDNGLPIISAESALRLINPVQKRK